MSSNYDDIRKYLLGGLDAAEREAIDLRLIDDEDFGVEALAAEDLLIESYVDGDLTETETALFHSHYLTTEDRARRVRELAVFRAAAQRSALEERENLATDTKGGQWSISGWLTGFTPVVVASVLLIALAGAGLWFYFSLGRPTGLEQEYAELNRGDMSDLNRLASYSTVELYPGTLRSGDAGSRIVTQNLTETVLFRLPLDGELRPDVPYRVMVVRDGNGVFSVYDRKPVRAGSVNEIRVLLPKKIFERGQYQIRVSQLETKTAPFVFNFTVE